MLFNLSERNSIANQFISELRDIEVQRDRLRFRKNLERLGQIMAYEISKSFEFQTSPIQTPLGVAESSLPADDPILIPVLRAALPYFNGFLNTFDKAECGFVGAYRKENSEELVINVDYLATPPVAGKKVILIDPMLATGKSCVQSIQSLMKHGMPSHIYIASVVAVREGITFIEDNLKVPHSIWTCAVDQRLNEAFYIVPGLGDAGDLSFGEKI